MISKQSSLPEITDFIKDIIINLYNKDKFLFDRNGGRGICERALVFRFAYYLQNAIVGFYVDCDFNSSYVGHFDANGQIIGTEQHGKGIKNPNGTITKRFVDVIVHKRDFVNQNDFICFEIKKWNNTNAKEARKDQNNLCMLTYQYGYKYGFHLILHRNIQNCRWTIFQKGSIIKEKSRVFDNEEVLPPATALG